ncbi:MAG TPA: hypothetical protein VIL37_16510 [Natronosporangium sp.]
MSGNGFGAPDGTGFEAALRPVRAALLAAARADAGRIVAEAEQAAAATLAQGRAAADRIRTEARAQGTASGQAVAAAARRRARRAARARVMLARREAYEQLRAAARRAVARLPAEPDWPRRRAALAAAVTARLGPGTVIRETADGGVVGERAGRRVDCSLAVLADRAADAVAQQLQTLEAR